MNTEPLTPLQQSAADTGRRFFACHPAVYAALCAQIDAARDYPQGEGTAAITTRGLPEADSLPADANERVLITVEVWRITAGDNAMLTPAIQAGQVEELTAAAFVDLLPAPPSLP